MKKTLIIFASILLSSAVALTSCTIDSGEKDNGSLIESYKADAQEYVDEGDIDSAIKTLKKGIDKTGDESLEDMLEMLESVSGNKASEKEKGQDAEPDVKDDAEQENESGEDYSSYSGSWSHSGWFEDASFELDVEKDKFDLSGTYTFYDYINDTNTTDAKFSASGTIKDGTAQIDCTDSNGTPFTLKLSFTSRQMTDKAIGYIVCDCLSYNGKTLSEIFEQDVDPSQYSATFYDAAGQMFLETIDLIEIHCKGDYSTGHFSDSGTFTQGGNFVDFALDGNNLTVHYTSVSAAPSSRISEIEETVDLSTAIVALNTIRFPFHEDSWGNSGVLTIEFNPGNGGPMVLCTLSDMVYASNALWYPVVTDEWYQEYNPNIKEPELVMTSEERRTLNIFLSNFCETDFYEYNMYNNGNTAKDDLEMMYFAFEHIMINSPGKAQHPTESVTSIFEDDINRVLDRFLGKTLPAVLPDTFSYQNGYVLTDAITHLQGQGVFSITTEMLYNDDGTINVYFDLFANHGATDADVYAMTYNEAKETCGESFGNGTAVIKEKTYNGQNTYELISYKIY